MWACGWGWEQCRVQILGQQRSVALQREREADSPLAALSPPNPPLPEQEGYVPIQQRPEAAFVPGLVQELLDALLTVGAPGGEGRQPAKLDRQQLLFCERSVEFLVDMLSQVLLLSSSSHTHAEHEEWAGCGWVGARWEGCGAGRVVGDCGPA